jgi:hypothetical protein
MNNKWWQVLISNLFKVKSLVTIMLTSAFVAMSLRGKVEPKDFYSIIVMVLTFYFGYQSAKTEDQTGGGSDGKAGN